MALSKRSTSFGPQSLGAQYGMGTHTTNLVSKPNSMQSRMVMRARQTVTPTSERRQGLQVLSGHPAPCSSHAPGRRPAVVSPICHAAESSNKPEVFHDIKLYLPRLQQNQYYEKKIKTTARGQLLTMYGELGFVKVLEADAKPPASLLFACDGVESSSIDTVELADGMVLALVLDSPDAAVPRDWLMALGGSMSRPKDTVSVLGGQSRNITAAEGRECAEWAVAQLHAAGHEGVERWSFNQMSLDNSVIELDGAATSSSHTVIIEREPEINFENILDFSAKIELFKMLVMVNVPNSGMFREASGSLKPIIAILMADNWTTNQESLKISKKLMTANDIFPALPDGKGGFAFGDSCHTWPTPVAL